MVILALASLLSSVIQIFIALSPTMIKAPEKLANVNAVIQEETKPHCEILDSNK